METWKKVLIGAILVALLIYAPQSMASFLHTALSSIGTFFSSLHLH